VNDEPFKLMGIVNVTPDSFSDGGLYLDCDAAIEHGVQLEREGAAILDIGGESTRPGAEPVGADTERERVVPVIEGLLAAGVSAQISVDTSKASVASAAISAGAKIVNDVTALRGDVEMAALIADAGVHCCLMHMLGEPRTMQLDPHYDDVVREVREFLLERIDHAVTAGIEETKIVLDPGIGFGKTVEHNLELLRGLDQIVSIGRPVLVGTSRKSFLGRITGRADARQRLPGTIATNVIAYERGATLFRVHEVAPVYDALKVAAATVKSPWISTTPTSTTR
jgi:dihydropteroate synthase